MEVIKKPTEFKINDKSFFIGHGDGLGQSLKYKFLKQIFRNPLFSSELITAGLEFLWKFFLKKQ